MRLLYCSLCKVAVNSASQLQAHNSGTKHKTMLEARRGGGAIKSFPRSGNKTFHCEICDVHVNSETQLKQHISSRRHKDRAAGKPAKPNYLQPQEDGRAMSAWVRTFLSINHLPPHKASKATEIACGIEACWQSCCTGRPELLVALLFVPG
ncbi:hypothetical protein NHX12_023630 [Muraenolepis orangiensis]|uniref:C2H2-type domain-containing protein n=1 Tax=Muraenolepis orangiensis TaxID=630683 RepID=A0A9Q0EL44_9TELE|nr:hypothetical protein NHX12_023630 [Muraenolepis orangiensis]